MSTALACSLSPMLTLGSIGVAGGLYAWRLERRGLFEQTPRLFTPVYRPFDETSGRQVVEQAGRFPQSAIEEELYAATFLGRLMRSV